MFFQTPFHLLAPLHSLLSKPFDFNAAASVEGRLKKDLQQRDDFDAIVQLAQLYESQRQQLAASLVGVRADFDAQFSPIISIEHNFGHLCHTSFLGQGSANADSAHYLAYVSVACQLERLSDLLCLTRSGQDNCLTHEQVCAMVRFLMLNETLALVLAGIARVRYADKVFVCEPFDDNALELLRATWFARWADQNAGMATLAYAQQLAQADLPSREDVEFLAQRIFDQHLSISWNRLTAQGRSLKSVVSIRKVLAIIACLMVSEMRHEQIRMSGPDFARYGLDYDALTELLRHQQDALLTDRFIVREGAFLALRIGAVAKGLRVYFDHLAKACDEVDLLRTHVGGKFFEIGNIRHALEHDADYGDRFRVVDGFDRNKVIDGGASECDVEFVLCDLVLEHYYFVQIKHSLLGERAFLDAVVRAAQNDFAKGVHQLREAKRLLYAGNLQKTLDARGIGNATMENSSFVLLHNVAQFDFQFTEDGIGLYDWTMFRNLLKDAEVTTGHSHGGFRIIRLPRPLLVDHPVKVIRTLLAEHPAYRGQQCGAWGAERIENSVPIGDVMLRRQGLGI